MLSKRSLSRLPTATPRRRTWGAPQEVLKPTQRGAMLQADFIADGLVPDAPPTLPPALRAVENLLTTSAINAANTLFLNTNAKPFRIFLDDACNMPSDWRSRSVSDETVVSRCSCTYSRSALSLQERGCDLPASPCALAGARTTTRWP